MFKPIRSVVETIEKIAPFCIPTCSLRLVFSSYLDHYLNGTFVTVFRILDDLLLRTQEKHVLA